jgi:transposase InsO family protein
MGIRDKPIAPGSPWQNGFAERLIGSIRRECVDHIVVLVEAPGRPKGLRNFTTDVRHMLKLRVKINDGGRSRDASTQEASLIRLREKALKGEPRGLDRMIELADRYNNDEANGAIGQGLAAEDQEILEAFKLKAVAEALKSNPPDSRPAEREPLPAPDTDVDELRL